MAESIVNDAEMFIKKIKEIIKEFKGNGDSG